jgi:hypothetical protein
MKVQRFEVSDAPHLTVSCYADVSINGGREGEVAIKAYGSEEDLEVRQEGDEFEITSRARCKVGCPRGTTLTLKEVSGDVRVRKIDGTITAEGLRGDASFGDVGPTTVGSVSGDMRARSVNGDLQMDHVSGDLSVRSVDGDVRTGSVAGDLSARGVKGSLTNENVSGDLSARGIEGLLKSTLSGDLDAAYLEGGLEVTAAGSASVKTDFTPGCTYQLTTNGNATVKFPASANARFVITALGNIHHKVDWAEMSVAPEGTLNGRVGDGEADVVITSSAGVTLLSRTDGGSFIYGFEPEDEEMGLDLELESMSEEIERNIEAHMARLNAHLEAELSRIDHSAIQLKAERVAERAAEMARRKAVQAAERARIKAERAQRRWARMGAGRSTPPSAPSPPRRKTDPVSEEERLMILTMVQEGKITTDDAARLLEALEG